MSTPRILVLDIETLPTTVASFSNMPHVPISHENILKEKQMLTAAWMWQGSDKVYSARADAKGDKELVQTLRKQIANADAVVAHYGDRFDMSWIQERCLVHDLGPLKPVIQIDTWKILASKFPTMWNKKLDYLVQILELGRKIKTDLSLWKRCLQWEDRALRQMLEYNKWDVRLLDVAYLKIRPYAPAKLNFALFEEDAELARITCPACGEKKLVVVDNWYSRTTVWQMMRCRTCKHPCKRPPGKGVPR